MQQQGVQIDANRVIAKLQQTHGERIAKMDLDMAAKDAFIDQQAEVIAEQQKALEDFAAKSESGKDNGQVEGVTVEIEPSGLKAASLTRPVEETVIPAVKKVKR